MYKDDAGNISTTSGLIISNNSNIKDMGRYGSYDLLCKNLRTLGIKKETLRDYKTLNELKQAAKKQYAKQMLIHHPDCRHRKRAPGSGYISPRSIQKLREANQWIQSLTEQVLDRQDRRNETVPDPPIPWNMDFFRRSVNIPWGFHETREFLNS